MDLPITNLSTPELVSIIREWSIDRVKYGTTVGGDALSIVEEFREWIEPHEDKIEILSLNDMGDK